MTKTYIIIVISADREGNDDDIMEEHIITTSVDDLEIGDNILKTIERYRVINDELTEKIKECISEEKQKYKSYERNCNGCGKIVKLIFPTHEKVYCSDCHKFSVKM